MHECVALFDYKELEKCEAFLKPTCGLVETLLDMCVSSFDELP